MSSKKTSNHVHCSIIDEFIELYRNAREMVLYRRYDDGTEKAWLNIRVVDADQECQRMRLFVYRPNRAIQIFFTRIVKCKYDKVELKGSIFYHHDNEAERFTLTLFKNKLIENLFEGRLELTGYNVITLFTIINNPEFSIPERIYFKINTNEQHLRKNDTILYGDTFYKFHDWDHQNSNQILVSSNDHIHRLSIDSCWVVFSFVLKKPRLIKI